MTDDVLPRDRINPALKSRISQEIGQIFPIASDDGKTLVRAAAISVDDAKFDPSDLNAQQRARERGGTRGARIMGDLELVRDGKVVQKRKVQLGTLPLMNDLSTFSVGGNDWYTPLAQLRLKNGAYTREKANGLYETFIRLKGRAMSVWMEADKGVLKIGYGTTNVNWYPVMQALGASDEHEHEHEHAVVVAQFLCRASLTSTSSTLPSSSGRRTSTSSRAMSSAARARSPTCPRPRRWLRLRPGWPTPTWIPSSPS